MSDSEVFDASFQKDADIEQFVHELRQRLYQGRQQYGDKSFDRPSNKIHQERLEEALDGAGWSFVLWKKFRDQQLSQPAESFLEAATQVDAVDDGSIVKVDGRLAMVKTPETLVTEIVGAMTERQMGKIGEDWAVSLKDAVEVISSALMVEAPSVDRSGAVTPPQS